MVFEDLHWVDPTSLEFLGRVVDATRRAPIMLFLTGRPHFRAPSVWREGAGIQELALPRLDQETCTAIIECIATDGTLSEACTDDIVARTDGVPLFIEELTRAMLSRARSDDRDRSAGRPVADVPTTLRDLLTARLDQLAPVTRRGGPGGGGDRSAVQR